MSATKIGKNTNNISNLTFFKIDLHIVTSNQLSTSGKLNLPLTNSIYFLFFITSRNAKKTQTNQNIQRVFLLCLKRNDPQTIKNGSCKNPFLQCVCYWYNLLRWMIFFYALTGRLYLLWKINITLRPYCCFLWSQCFERKSVFFCVISTIAIWC